MKRERLEELAIRICTWHAGHDETLAEVCEEVILAVERETVERCAEVCVGERLADIDAKLTVDRYYNMACSDCAEKIRSLLTEET